MKNAQEIIAMLGMSFGEALSFPWVTVTLAVLLAVAVGSLIFRRTKPLPIIGILLLSIPVWCLLFAWMAVTFMYDRESAGAFERAAVPSAVLDFLALAALAEGIACVVLAKTQRIAASTVASCGAWLVFWVYFIASMSISGVWL